jgi:hypothetical protein
MFLQVIVSQMSVLDCLDVEITTLCRAAWLNGKRHRSESVRAGAEGPRRT